MPLPACFYKRFTNAMLVSTNNIRGFKRAAGPHVSKNTVAYYHTHFQKGKPELLKDMAGGGKKKDNQLQEASISLSSDLIKGGVTFPHSHLFKIPNLEGFDMTTSALLFPGNRLNSQFFSSTTGLHADHELRLQSLLASRQSAELAARQHQQAAANAQAQAMLAEQLVQQTKNSQRRRLLNNNNYQHADQLGQLMAQYPLRAPPMDPALLLFEQQQRNRQNDGR
jgi:hypothetical protein